MTYQRAPRVRGICISCAELLDCVESNQGLVCDLCQTKIANGDRPAHIKGTLYVVPAPDAVGYAMIDGVGSTFLTIGGTLYVFDTEEAGHKYLDGLKARCPEDLSKVSIKQVNVRHAFDYCYRNHLSILMVSYRPDAPPNMIIKMP